MHKANKYTRQRASHPSSRACATVCTLLALCRPFKEVAWTALEAHYIVQQAMAACAVSFISIVDGSHFRAICLDPVYRTLKLIDPAGVDSMNVLREVAEVAEGSPTMRAGMCAPSPPASNRPRLTPYTRAAAAMVTLRLQVFNVNGAVFDQSCCGVWIIVLGALVCD